MLIRELAARTNISAKTIRYYEAIGLLSPPRRAPNNYRHYTPAAIERLRFIAGARSFGFSLRDIAAILAARDGGTPPCDDVLSLLVHRLADLDRRIADMLALRAILTQLHATGAGLPRDDVAGERCVCALLKTYGEHGRQAEGAEPQHA